MSIQICDLFSFQKPLFPVIEHFVVVFVYNRIYERHTQRQASASNDPNIYILKNGETNERKEEKRK